jgi:hypothetical protein
MTDGVEGPVNLLTKRKAWHTHNIIRIDVELSLRGMLDITVSGTGGTHEVRVDDGGHDSRRSLNGRLCQSKEV